MPRRSQIDPHEFRRVHALGLLDGELAHWFGVSLSTAKRLKKELNLGDNYHRTQVGSLGERLVADHFSRQGLAVSLKSRQSRFDLFVAGYRVDVKTSKKPTPSGSYRFRLTELRPSFRGAHVYRKNYKRDADFIALACLQEDELRLLHVLPCQDLPESITVRPSGPAPQGALEDPLAFFAAHPVRRSA